MAAFLSTANDLAPPSISHAANEIWHYFYIQHVPHESERRAWSRIEAAAFRIRESEQFLRDRYPAAVQVNHARRVRRAAREIQGQITRRLVSSVDEFVSSYLAYLDVLSDAIITEYRDLVAAQPLH